ncbi:DUF2142 domain-containing protein [Leifsonia sp. NPDC080035]|uniref:DUF2142 domain-containing protein n=1 Tax=Leifsonia sp. NPDC080035 TaxID=3143936 RepID=A0AAU7GA79_9MICO
MSSAQPVRPARRRFRAIFLVPILIFLALASWAVSSPLGTSPDDDFHLASSYCGLGERAGLCADVPGQPIQRAVPAAIVKITCGRGGGTYTQCRIAGESSEAAPVATKRWNYAGAYPPIYYTVTGVFASEDVGRSAMVMRAFNVLLFAGLGTLLFWLLPRIRRTTMLWMWSATVVPLGMFLIASNNPSSWAILSGGTLWLALLGFFETRGRRMWGLGALAAVGALMGAGARPDSAAYVAVAAVAVTIFEFRRTREFALKCIAPAVIVVLGILFYLGSKSTASTTGLVGGHQASSLPPLDLIWNNIVQLPNLYAGALGTWGLGWIDTPMPAVVWVFAIGVLGAALFAGAVSFGKRKLWGVLVVGLALVAVPSWVLYQGKALVGQEVQPRYVLPLLIMFVGFMLLQTERRPLVFSRFQTISVAAALTVANAVALHTNIRRYISGLQVTDPNLNHYVQQWWLGPFSPMLLWAFGTVTFAGAVAIALLYTRTPEPVAGPELPPETTGPASTSGRAPEADDLELTPENAETAGTPGSDVPAVEPERPGQTAVPMTR